MSSASGGCKNKYNWLLPLNRDNLDTIMKPFFLVTTLAYVLLRCYFFVESLASLMGLPTSMYDTMRWVDFLLLQASRYNVGA